MFALFLYSSSLGPPLMKAALPLQVYLDLDGCVIAEMAVVDHLDVIRLVTPYFLCLSQQETLSSLCLIPRVILFALKEVNEVLDYHHYLVEVEDVAYQLLGPWDKEACVDDEDTFDREDIHVEDGEGVVRSGVGCEDVERAEGEDSVGGVDTCDDHLVAVFDTCHVA